MKKRADELEVGNVIEMAGSGWEKKEFVAIEEIRQSSTGKTMYFKSVPGLITRRCKMYECRAITMVEVRDA